MRLDRYLIWQLLKSTFVGSFFAIVVLLGLQVLRLSDLIIRYDLEVESVLQMLRALSLSFTPLVFPIAFLFALLSVFGRLSSDREFVAMLSMGRSPLRILAPCLFFGVVMSVTTAWVSFTVGPRGNRDFEISIDDAFKRRVSSALRSGTFSEGFLGMVVFVDHVDPTMENLDRVFIHDETSFRETVSISARKGKWIQSTDEGLGILRLFDGVTVSQDNERKSVRRVNFDEYSIYADFSRQSGTSRQSPPSLTGSQLFEARIANRDHAEVDPRPIWVELSRRFAVSFLCLLFVPLAFGLSHNTARTVKSLGVFSGLVILLSYWTIYFSLVTWVLKARFGNVASLEGICWAVIWTPNLITLIAGLLAFRNRSGLKRH